MMKSQIMYIELKGEGINGPGRIGRVTVLPRGGMLYYRGQVFEPYVDADCMCNYIAADSEEAYWISECKPDGTDRLYPGTIEIDDDAREEYWTTLRDRPECANESFIQSSGKYGRPRAHQLV